MKWSDFDLVMIVLLAESINYRLCQDNHLHGSYLLYIEGFFMNKGMVSYIFNEIPTYHCNFIQQIMYIAMQN